MVAFFIAQIFSGISTVDQTCFGLGVGVIVAFFCNSVLLKPIDKHVTMLMNGEYQVLGYGTIMRNLALACTFLTLY
jgi:hypothetical protein